MYNQKTNFTSQKFECEANTFAYNHSLIWFSHRIITLCSICDLIELYENVLLIWAFVFFFSRYSVLLQFREFRDMRIGLVNVKSKIIAIDFFDGNRRWENERFFFFGAMCTETHFWSLQCHWQWIVLIWIIHNIFFFPLLLFLPFFSMHIFQQPTT